MNFMLTAIAFQVIQLNHAEQECSQKDVTYKRDDPEALTPGAHRRTSLPFLNRPVYRNTLFPSPTSSRITGSKTPQRKTRSFTISSLPVILVTKAQDKQGVTLRTTLEDTSNSETQSEATDESVDPLETELPEFDPGFSFVTRKLSKSEEVLIAPKDVLLEAIEDDMEARDVRVDRRAFPETAEVLSGL
ncbi:hypothetical protein AAF712_012106 [Marasmius tenuissimus]|uniref:Uncharacterized protein n=1 Tax=Marasmius tenuissimus TaxID=585030 RepID=A0ABR2ZHH6_9AGAR